jgi:putative ABC transport system permease protein
VSAPRWAGALLRRLAPADRADDVLGDLEEAHRTRVRRRGWVMASLLTGLEALDMGLALLRERTGGALGGRGRGPDRERERGARARITRGGGGGFSWLDFKLGFRMLVKYPGLTLVGGVAIAFSIWAGASFFEFVTQVTHPKLPLDDGDRIVGIQLWDAASSRVEPRALHDYGVWRETLTSVEELGAFRTLARNLTVEGRGGEAIEVAEISASAFRLARTPPLLGRFLDASDELAAAPPVTVIGYDLWQRRFGGDPKAVGQTVRLGREASTVVGVMPPGFRFPVSNELWVPLRVNALEHGPGEGPGIRVFGRLAPGFTIREAQAELTALGGRAAADSPGTHEHLRPRVLGYAQSILGVPAGFRLGLASSNLFVVMLLVLVCGNVALLMFARAASRESEIVVRNALGASRGRIVMQLFAEALVLGGVGTALGLAAAGYGLRLLMTVVEAEVGPLPFWFDDRLSAATLLYAAVLTVLGAVIAGVVPALKVTSGGVEGRLRQSAVGRPPVRFGGIWTVVIVAQVAVTVAFPATAWFVRRDMIRVAEYDFGFPVDRYLSVRLQLEAESRPGVLEETRAQLSARFAETARALEARLAAEPEVVRTTLTDRLPGTYHPWQQIEVDEGAVAPPDPRGHRVGNAHVDPGYFAALGSGVVHGRAFDSADLESELGVVIVNEAFVDEVLGGKNPLGRRVRYVASDQGDVFEPGPWHEIVGVAPQLGVQNGYGAKGIYHPAGPGDAHPVYMAVHLTGDPQAFGPRLRTLAASVDPALQLHALKPLNEARSDDVVFYAFWYRITAMVSVVALFLALAGIYAVMAFTVSRRTREIGIRVALGSDRRRVTLSIFRRPLTQVAVGVLVGSAWAAFLSIGIQGGLEHASVKGAVLIGGYSALMMAVCMLACVVPTRRALRIEPTEALKAEG